MNRLIVICGPTATGKTKLALKLAKKFNGELISADSRQIYKGMDIGTGKDHPKDIAIHLVDVVNPNEQFSVAQYVELATKTIKDIWDREKLPILVGGTGFYIRGVVDGIETIGVPPDWELRKKLQNYTVSQLQRLLEETCPERLREMNKSDRSNPRRLIRAIEIATAKAQNPDVMSRRKNAKEIKVLFIGLTAPNKILYQRIDKRVDKRVEQGVVEEIKNLVSQGYSWENSVLGETIGYKEWREYFERQRKTRFSPKLHRGGSYFKGKTTLEEVIQRWKYDEHDYARRQTTWFKKDKRIKWFDIIKSGLEKEVVKLVRKWYSKNDA